MAIEFSPKKIVKWISWRELEEECKLNVISVKKLESLFGTALLLCVRNGLDEYNVIVDDGKYIYLKEAQRRELKKYYIIKSNGRISFKLSEEEKSKKEKNDRKKIKPRKHLISDNESDNDADEES